jgi:hypothetical protein
VITFGSVPLVLMLIALVACALADWRALRVEPISALRSDES